MVNCRVCEVQCVQLDGAAFERNDRASEVREPISCVLFAIEDEYLKLLWS